METVAVWWFKNQHTHLRIARLPGAWMETPALWRSEGPACLSSGRSHEAAAALAPLSLIAHQLARSMTPPGRWFPVKSRLCFLLPVCRASSVFPPLTVRHAVSPALSEAAAWRWPLRCRPPRRSALVMLRAIRSGAVLRRLVSVPGWMLQIKRSWAVELPAAAGSSICSSHPADPN